MASENLRFYYQSKNKNEGLSPTLRIVNDSETVKVAAGTAMTHATRGYYYYDYTATAQGGYHAEITVSELPTPVEQHLYATLDSGLSAVTGSYTTVSKVEGFLHLPTLSSSTTPTSTQVSLLIGRAEDQIDTRTGHAWRTRYSGTSSGADTTAQYEYYDIDNPYETLSGRPIYLKHRKIKSLDTGSGDELSVWDGASWVNYTTGKTEGRGNDFWLDYNLGILYIRTWAFSSAPAQVRIKYRYGESTVPYDIEDAATKMVAIDLLFTDDRAVQLPEGVQTTYATKVSYWRSDVKNIISSHAEIMAIGSML